MKQVTTKPIEQISYTEAAHLFCEGKIVASVYDNHITFLITPTEHWKYGFVSLSSRSLNDVHSADNAIIICLQKAATCYVFDSLAEVITTMKQNGWHV